MKKWLDPVAYKNALRSCTPRRAAATAGLLLLAAMSGVARAVHPLRSAPRPPASAAVTALQPVVERAEVVPVPALARADAWATGLDPRRLDDAVDAVLREARRGAFPGGAVAIGRRNSLVMLKGVGRTEWDGREVDPRSTIYDLASLTKVVATTTAVMLLVEDGRMELDAPVHRYLPEFAGDAKDRVTIRHLLAHTSGLPAWAEPSGATPQRTLEKLVATPLQRAPGESAVYSDVGMVVLFAAAERAAGEPLPALLQRRVYGPLGMTSTGYLPGSGCYPCAPTLPRADFHGQVHDPIARQLGGIAGNAGLFSTAEDLGRFAAMLAGWGELEGVRVLREETIRRFVRRQAGAGNRALGWETPERDGTGSGGRAISPSAFGHTGFTGTSLWVDPELGIWTVLLTNRTYDPRAPNRIMALRRAVNDGAARAAIDGVEPAE